MRQKQFKAQHQKRDIQASLQLGIFNVSKLGSSGAGAGRNPSQSFPPLLDAWMISLRKYADPLYVKLEKRKPPGIKSTKFNPESKILTRKISLHYSVRCQMEKQPKGIANFFSCDSQETYFTLTLQKHCFFLFKFITTLYQFKNT